jgi:hypothetical protein
MAYDNFLIDKRVVERNIAKGLVDPSEYKRVVEALPDRESNCVHVSLEGDAGQASASSAEDEAYDDEDEDEDDEEDEGDEG